MSKVTLGGERLGAGGKMQVEIKSYERSTHDLGYLWRSSMAPGTLVPFMVLPTLPGDTFDIDLNADVNTHPTLGPLFGSFKLQLDIFEAPVRLYHSALLQNTTQLGNNMASVILPALVSDNIPQTLPATIANNPDNQQINPSCILSYLGIRGWGINQTGVGSQNRNLNGVPYLAYWEIYRNYYSNKQETFGYYIGAQTTGPTTVTSITIHGTILPQNINGTPIIYSPGDVVNINFTGTPPQLNQIILQTTYGPIRASDWGSWSQNAGVYSLITTQPVTTFLSWAYSSAVYAAAITQFPLTNIDAVKTAIYVQAPTTRFNIPSSSPAPYGPPIALANSAISQMGLALKTYQSDLFNNWMQAAWYLNIQNATAISVAGNINVDTIILARKVYELLNRIAISGGTYQDWINAVYDHEPYSICNSPIYHGGLSKEIVFQQVISTAGQNAQPLGTLAGRGTLGHKHKGGKLRIKCHEHGYLIGIVSITPRLDYSQGNAWHTYALTTMNDYHKPALDQIGFQDLINEQMAWWDSTLPSGGGGTAQQHAAGKQPAWTNYMTETNKTFGNFAVAGNEMFMTLNRRYTMSPTTGQIQDLTTYIDPTKYNFIFAQTSLDAQNFWVQIAVDNTARRKMSHKIMPNL